MNKLKSVVVTARIELKLKEKANDAFDEKIKKEAEKIVDNMIFGADELSAHDIVSIETGEEAHANMLHAARVGELLNEMFDVIHEKGVKLAGMKFIEMNDKIKLIAVHYSMDYTDIRVKTMLSDIALMFTKMQS